MSSGAAAVAAAAAARRAMLLEEEQMTTYGSDDLAHDWEFKIVRANTGAFRNTASLNRLLQEEARAGWIMLEKFDNSRIRFKRPRQARSNDSTLPPGCRSVSGALRNVACRIHRIDGHCHARSELRDPGFSIFHCKGIHISRLVTLAGLASRGSRLICRLCNSGQLRSQCLCLRPLQRRAALSVPRIDRGTVPDEPFGRIHRIEGAGDV